MRKAKGPKKNNKKFVTHLMTMPQAAGKKVVLRLKGYFSSLKLLQVTHTYSSRLKKVSPELGSGGPT